MSEFFHFVETALESSVPLARDFFGKTSSSVKKDDHAQVVTEADIAVGKHIISLITAKYPEHNILDEEAGVVDRHSDFTWIIDPIDGTSNFAAGSPLYGIKLALVRGNEVVAGGIALPYFKEVYVAERGSGAFLGKDRVQVLQDQDMVNMLISFGMDGQRRDPSQTMREADVIGNVALACRNVRSSNSAFDEALVVKGVYGAFFGIGNKIWDDVAPSILVEEAGGIATDYFGKPMDFSNPLQKGGISRSMLIGSKVAYHEILKIING